ncbi:hypothetical protein J1N35_044646 [Gossypium stocksii]|uniref:Uncharacterized protein n=1 Tax=Gossypium stocksii TaxID=47602 RepID=A0A9D3U9N3_9ROSI|nr:hypothetical protein J1N35_044646 [Gossypium stocksii]
MTTIVFIKQVINNYNRYCIDPSLTFTVLEHPLSTFVIFFAKTSADSLADKPGEGILDYVAGHPELPLDSYKSD